MLSKKFVPHWAKFAVLAVAFLIAGGLTLTLVGSGSATAKENGRPMTMTVEDAHITTNVPTPPTDCFADVLVSHSTLAGC